MEKQTDDQAKICIVGLGNTLRSDDGIGAYICRLLGERKNINFDMHITQQLDMGITEKMGSYVEVIFIDAAPGKNMVELILLPSDNSSSYSFTHQLTPSVIAALAHQLYESRTRFYLCCIPAEEFGMGETISQDAKAHAEYAVTLIEDRFR